MLKLGPKIVSLFFPARCIGCDVELSLQSDSEKKQVAKQADSTSKDNTTLETQTGSAKTSLFDTFEFHWCIGCWRKLVTAAPARCVKCSAVLYRHNPFVDRCAVCHDNDLRFEQAISIGNYRGLLQELVIRLKNQHDEQLTIQLANILALEILASDYHSDLNLVIPVPSHWWRRFRRGFQASEVIAETVSTSCDIPYAGQILSCVRETKKQGTLSTTGRFKNVRGAFQVRPSLNVQGLTILLVDDVMTSGATVSEMARVLLKAGAAKVYVGVIARGAGVS